MESAEVHRMQIHRNLLFNTLGHTWAANARAVKASNAHAILVDVEFMY